METLRKCPICDSEDISFLMSAKDYLLTLKEFSIDKCSGCSLLFTNPRPSPEEIGAFYDATEYISHEDSRKTFLDKTYQVVKKRMIKKKIKLIKSFFDKEKRIQILDYGCGTGGFLAECQKKNFVVAGVEPDSKARNKALKKGVKALESVEKIDKTSVNRFDVISLWHSLEHVHDVKNTLYQLSLLLKKDGILVVAVPQYQSYDAKIYKNFWAAYDLPRHLYHFDEKTLSMCLPKNKFKPCKKKGLVFDSYYVSVLSEKNKKRNTIFAVMFGLIIGMLSNLNALIKKTPYSSQIYVFRKLAKE